MIRSLFRSRVYLPRVLPRLSYCSESLPVEDSQLRRNQESQPVMNINGSLIYLYNNVGFYTIGIKEFSSDEEQPGKIIKLYANKLFHCDQKIQSFRLKDHVTGTAVFYRSNPDGSVVAYLNNIHHARSEADEDLERGHKNVTHLMGEVKDVIQGKTATVFIVVTMKEKRNGNVSRMTHRIVANNSLVQNSVEDLKGALVTFTGSLSNDYRNRETKNCYFVVANSLEIVSNAGH